MSGPDITLPLGADVLSVGDTTDRPATISGSDGHGRLVIRVEGARWHRELAFGVAWRTSTEIAIAAAMDERREFLGGH